MQEKKKNKISFYFYIFVLECISSNICPRTFYRREITLHWYFLPLSLQEGDSSTVFERVEFPLWNSKQLLPFSAVGVEKNNHRKLKRGFIGRKKQKMLHWENLVGIMVRKWALLPCETMRDQRVFDTHDGHWWIQTNWPQPTALRS